jgi:penicillin-binding protein 1A
MSTSRSTTGTTKGRINKLFTTEKPWFRRVIKYSWILFICAFLGVPLYLYTVSIDLFGLYGGMPSLREVENPENDLSSELLAADGASLGRYFRFNRSQVSFHELSPELVNTLMISEDHRFYQHSGLDLPSYLRVVFGLLTLNPQGGGSTITQQLAKNLYTQNPDKSLDGALAKLGKYPKRLIEKTKEWIIAVNLEKSFTKEEIIAMYLNTSAFSNNAFGIKVAAETYFNKEPDSLNLQESAVLVGMLQRPSYYNPQKWPDRATKIRNTVLSKVHHHGYKITTLEQLDSIQALPIDLKFKVQDHNEGPAQYFRTVIGNWLISYCNSRGIDLYNSGLRIYTTIDSRLQKYAEEAVAEHMSVLQKEFTRQWKERKMDPWLDDENKPFANFLKTRIKRAPAYQDLAARYGENSDSLRIMLNLKKPMTVFSWGGEKDTVMSLMDSLNYYKRFLQTGMMAMDPTTGDIKAWVGGINHKYFSFDHVKQGKRQAGSTFKPFVYGLAMEEGFSPCQKMKDISPVFKVPEGVWYPPNSDGSRGSGEVMNLRQAMARSVNTITAQVMQQLTAQNVVEFAHRVGIESKLDAVPSLCLGTSDVSVYEMVGGYSTYANGGIFIKPFFITRIEDKNGNVIENFVPETRQSVSDQTAFKMLYMLMGGVEEEGGTSGGLPRDLKFDKEGNRNEIGGKTGTTNDASDGWYMGVTHDLVTGIWVGGDERAIRFPSWVFGSGTKSARPIWSNFMTKVYADEKSGIVKGQFKRPPTGLDISLDCNKATESDSLYQYVEPFEINN